MLDWLYPTIFALLSTAFLWKFGRPGLIAGQSGLLDRLIIVCSILPGFYIAALAAIATFNRPDIDAVMPDPTPTLKVEIGGRPNVIDLTRRRFLAYLFAFLCWESIALLVACVFAGVAAAGIMEALGAYASLAKYTFLSVLLLLFWQLVFATCLGLYYLGDRLNRPTY
ncbi:hypothetical protein K8O61_18340 [Xanthomonas cerealis pv. cerealis]|uniref:hypothetical protein n=1 Tax=Xanthomonas translucens group TaxID=3390202 RepID=UPI001F1B84AF|nr:hypothetical protein [Xanthomonas translucens]UKE69357.1 hypothetical protein K8O61_18340 [Xanthomonas translucens pv. pistacia]UKE73149.1 hypothetical protein KFS85_19390 [Xanthomonas translucens pv. phleipratensis]